MNHFHNCLDLKTGKEIYLKFNEARHCRDDI